MLDNRLSDPEFLWDSLLSRQEQRIIAAFHSLNTQEQLAVVDHLKRMISKPGWHPEQRISAQTALDALDASFD